MVNINKLRGKVVENGMKVSDLAEAMNIDRATLYRKLARDTSFSVEEANKIVEILGLSPSEAYEIFFGTKLA